MIGSGLVPFPPPRAPFKMAANKSSRKDDVTGPLNPLNLIEPTPEKGGALTLTLTLSPQSPNPNPKPTKP